MVDTAPIERVLTRPEAMKKQRKRAAANKTDLLKERRESVRVQKIISVLSKRIEPRYCHRPRNYWLIQIHKKPGSKYFKSFCQMYKYLLELRGEHSNSIESLIYDYLDCIYAYYKEYRRLPSLSQLRPYESNQVLFIEWIHEWEQERDEDYWVNKEDAGSKNIPEEAAKILNGKSEIIVDNIGITETKRG